MCLRLRTAMVGPQVDSSLTCHKQPDKISPEPEADRDAAKNLTASLVWCQAYSVCWMPASTQPPLPWRVLVRCQISSNDSSGAPLSSRMAPVKRTLTR